MRHRPRRLRFTESTRRLVRETQLVATDFILPIFICEGAEIREEISVLPGVYRYSLDALLHFLNEVSAAGIRGIALFPKVDDGLKNEVASEALNPDGLVPRAVRLCKQHFPQLLVFTDIALDPFSSDGHDGLVQGGVVANDASVDVLARMAVVHAQAGADFVAPSDMMDGRVGALRDALDEAGFEHVGILSYTAKYASALYAPFRVALDSAPRIQMGRDIPKDKKGYQMDPGNAREALRELQLDLEEGADMVMVKPALFYLDIIKDMSQYANVPVAAYHVSGEYAIVCAAAAQGLCDRDAVMMEALTAIKRAGAKVILTYFALEAVRILRAEA